ncbi:MAG: SBBP repeat-containing protein, partial [Methanoregulaceae archaeon]|nr:SBBP repeat-containing protein [Methanoregulaceae archaeon]
MKTKAILLLLLLLVLFTGLADAGAGREGMMIPSVSPDISELFRTLPVLSGDFIADTTVTAQAGDQEWIPAMPLFFITNDGQSSDDVLFEVISDGGPISYTREGSVFRMIGYAGDEPIVSTVGSRYIGGTDNPVVEGIDPLSCQANFIQGADQSGWVTGVNTFRAVRYGNLYPGIDLLYEGSEEGIKSTFIVSPWAHPDDIIIEFYGHTGLILNSEGDLLIATDSGLLTQTAPVSYQVIDGKRVEVSSSFALYGEDRIGFNIGAYDTDKPLIIDPVMKYGLYLRGIGMANSYGVAVGPGQNVYVTGKSYPAPYVTNDSGNGSNAGGTDVVVIKINTDGTLPLYVTYIGGNGDDTAQDITVDTGGQVYITGTTSSTNFPVATPVQAYQAGMNDAFVSKLTSNGTSLVYSTYVGGAEDDYGNSIAIDTQHNVYITGSTSS